MKQEYTQVLQTCTHNFCVGGCVLKYALKVLSQVLVQSSS